MKEIYTLLLLLIIVLIPFRVNSNDVLLNSSANIEVLDDGLTDEELEKIKRRIDEYVEKFLVYLQHIGNRPYMDKFRKKYEELAAAMFKAGSEIEVSNIHNEIIGSFLPAVYFRRFDSLPYDQINLSFEYQGVKEFKVNELGDRATAEGHYYQLFFGSSKVSEYHDKTWKKIEVLAEKVDGNWVITFGNIEVIHTSN